MDETNSAATEAAEQEAAGVGGSGGVSQQAEGASVADGENRATSYAGGERVIGDEGVSPADVLGSNGLFNDVEPALVEFIQSYDISPEKVEEVVRKAQDDRELKMGVEEEAKRLLFEAIGFEPGDDISDLKWDDLIPILEIASETPEYTAKVNKLMLGILESRGTFNFEDNEQGSSQREALAGSMKFEDLKNLVGNLETSNTKRLSELLISSEENKVLAEAIGNAETPEEAEQNMIDAAVNAGMTPEEAKTKMDQLKELGKSLPIEVFQILATANEGSDMGRFIDALFGRAEGRIGGGVGSTQEKQGEVIDKATFEGALNQKSETLGPLLHRAVTKDKGLAWYGFDTSDKDQLEKASKGDVEAIRGVLDKLLVFLFADGSTTEDRWNKSKIILSEALFPEKRLPLGTDVYSLLAEKARMSSTQDRWNYGEISSAKLSGPGKPIKATTATQSSMAMAA